MNLRIVPIGANDLPLVTRLFATIAEDKYNAGFHPHDFTAAEAHRRISYQGGDLYAVLACGEVPIGYGMLRGWDQGYAIPSLGIYVVQEFRGRGIARALMTYLHATASMRSSPRIRLKVWPQNEPARRLYESLGYVFNKDLENGQFVGYLNLK